MRKLLLFCFLNVNIISTINVISCRFLPHDPDETDLEEIPEELYSYTYDIKNNGVPNLTNLIKALNRTVTFKNYVFEKKDGKMGLFVNYVSQFKVYKNNNDYLCSYLVEKKGSLNSDDLRFSKKIINQLTYSIDERDLERTKNYLTNLNLQNPYIYDEYKAYLNNHILDYISSDQNVVAFLKSLDGICFIRNLSVFDGNTNLLDPQAINKNYIFQNIKIKKMDVVFILSEKNNYLHYESDCVNPNNYNLSNFTYDKEAVIIGGSPITYLYPSFEKFITDFCKNIVLRESYINSLLVNCFDNNQILKKDNLLFLNNTVLSIAANNNEMEVKITSKNNISHFTCISNNYEEFKNSFTKIDFVYFSIGLKGNDSYLRGSIKNIKFKALPIVDPEV